MSYGTKYIVPFRTLSEIPCEIRFDVKDYTGEAKELIGGEDPIKIEVDTSGMLIPIRSSSATISVYGSDYLQDLYTSDPFGIKVTLKVNGNIHWLGYLTPDTFSQDFTHPEFIYEMECVSAFSTLKNRDFDLTSGFVPFLEIIKKARDYAGYSDLYLTNETLASDVPWYNLKISASNFYDELGEAMTYYEVLEEIAKYFGFTIVPHEDDLYFIDYIAIKNEYVSYSRVVGDTINGTLERDTKNVEGYKGTGAKISRIAGKNKAVVNCSLYEIKDILPSFDDEKSIFVDMETDTSVQQTKDPITWKEVRRYYTQSKFDMYVYDTGASEPAINHSKLDWQLGSMFIRSAEYDERNKPSKLSFTDELLVKRHDITRGNLNNTQPVITLRSKNKVITHGNLYFCISASVKATVTLFNKNVANELLKKENTDTVFQLYAKLKVGDKYFDGMGWVNTETRFSTPITVSKGNQINETYISVDNTNTFETGIGNLDGFIIKAPTEIQIGYLELTLYVFDGISSKYAGTILDRYLRYKDIQLTYGIPNEQSIYGDWVDKDSKNDLIYTNVIEGDYIEEADEIDLKICTNPDGKLALSSVIKGNEFLEVITTDAFGTDIPENILLKKVIELYKTPRFVIDPVLENNAKPYTVFTEPHLNKEFMNAGGEEDVKMESMRFNLIEL